MRPNQLLHTLSDTGLAGVVSVALLTAASAMPRWAAVATFRGSSGLPDALSAAFVQGMRSVLLAAVPLLATALTRSRVRGRATARPA